MNINHTLLLANATRDDIIYSWHDGQITGREFVIKTYSRALYLQAHGLTSGDTAILFMEDSIAWLVNLHALMLIGVRTCILNSKVDPMQVNDIADKLQATCVIDSVEFSSDTIDPADFLAYEWLPEQVALIFTTSGTTQNQQLVLHTYNALHELSQRLDYVNIKPDSVIMCPAKFSFVIGLVMHGLMPLLYRCRSYILTHFMQIKNITRLIKQEQITDLFVGVYGVKLMLKQQTADLGPQLRQVITGSEPLPHSVAKHFSDRFGLTLSNCYGLTETFFAVAMERDGSNLPNRIGSPVLGFELAVKDEHGNQCKDGQTGRMWIRSSMNAVGYLNQTDHKVFIDGWIRTNDLVYQHGSDFYFVSRVGQSIKVNGQLVSAIDVESAVQRIPGIEDCVCCFDNDQDGNASIYLGIIVDAHQIVNRSYLRSLLIKQGFKFLPDKIYQLNELALTLTNKKIRSRQLLETTGLLID